MLLLLALSPGRLSAAETNLPSLFVAPLHGDARAGYWQPAVGDGLAEMLVTELTKLGKFDVLESTTLESLKDEIKMGEDGWIEPGEKVEKGHFAGADYMFVGKVVRFGHKSSSYGGGGVPLPIRVPGGFGVSRNVDEVEIVWRITDAATRKILVSGNATGKETGTSWGFGGVLGHGFYREREFQNSALGKATIKAISTIIADVGKVTVGPGTRARMRDQKLAAHAQAEQAEALKVRSTPGRVEAVLDGVIIVSLGAKHSLKPGQKLNLYEVVELKNKEGKVVFTEEKLAGEVVVETVLDEKTKARFTGSLSPKEGWIVRAQDVAGAAKN